MMSSHCKNDEVLLLKSIICFFIDESPQACKLFVDLDGLNKYLRLLEVHILSVLLSGNTCYAL